MPPEASFNWPGGDGSLSLVDLGLYWPQKHPTLCSADGWSDGHRFVAIAALDRGSTEAAA
jgi:hypothetical protein